MEVLIEEAIFEGQPGVVLLIERAEGGQGRPFGARPDPYENIFRVLAIAVCIRRAPRR